MGIIRIVDEAVSIFTVAAHYGLPWAEDTGRRQQVHCPMHSDNTPSSRVYPDSNSGFCWTCQAAYGPSKLAAVQEGVSITRAAHILARRYAIDTSPDADLAEFRALVDRWERGPETNTPEARRAASLAVRAAVVDWSAAQQLLPLYDALDAQELTPEDFLDLARLALSQPST